MKKLSIREMRASLGNLDELLEREGEIVLTRRGRPVARVLPMRPLRRLRSHRELRRSMPLLAPSADLVRADRDERG